MYMHCVIGSGPAGVACAKDLLTRGAEALMFDAGIELEPQRAELVRQAWLIEYIAMDAGRHRNTERRNAYPCRS
jgi:NADPH-dependent 2,4-dienoyl-CoA reductase/sulfur reductase-like enzyme